MKGLYMSSGNHSLQNPFASPDPVLEPSRFYGHRADIQRIYTRIGASRPQSISIVGERKIGKSSLLNMLSNQETKSQFLPEPNKYIFGHLRLRERNDWKPDEFLRSLTDTMRNTHPDLPDGANYDEFRSMIQHLDAEHISIIAFFDDFDVITQDPGFPLTFFSFLRSIANTFNVAYITSSSEPLQRLCVSKDLKESPFFNIFTNITLKPLAENEVRQWIIEGSNPSGISLSSESEWVYSQVGGFPDMVRILCGLLWERKKSIGKLNSTDLQETEVTFQEYAKDSLEHIWSLLNEKEQAVCAQLLTGNDLERSQMHLVRELVRRGYVNEADGNYSLFGKSFERFVSDKTGLEIPTEQAQKKHWWKFGK